MAVYHFTWHAHGTWRPDNPRGYVERGKGILPPDPVEADFRDNAEAHPRVEFDAEMQKILIVGIHDICSRRRWRSHAVGTDPTHVHLVVSWTEFVDFAQAQLRMKNVLSWFLGRLEQKPGGKWFVGNGSRKRVRDQAHFDHLVNVYLPGHRGIFWKEGQTLPEVDRRIIDPGATAHGYQGPDDEDPPT